MKSKYGREIAKGDLIIAIFNNYAEVGFYLGKGSGSSHQYYSITNLEYWLKNNNDGPWKLKTPPKSYISNATGDRFIKYSESLITDEKKLEIYNKALEALKLLNI